MVDDLYAPITRHAETPIHRYVRAVLAARELQKKTDEIFEQAEEAWMTVPLEIQGKIIKMSPEELETMIRAVAKELRYSGGN